MVIDYRFEYCAIEVEPYFSFGEWGCNAEVAICDVIYCIGWREAMFDI